MAAKEAAIVAGIVGGAGGAGTSYATNNFGFGFGTYEVRDPNFWFVPLSCVKPSESLFDKDEINRLAYKIKDSAKVVDVPADLGSLTEVKKGCFRVQSYRAEDKTILARIGFELAAWNKDTESASDKGIVIWSSLFLNQDSASLVSRVFYLSKGTGPNSKLVAEKGLQFETKIDGVKDETSLKLLLKEVTSSNQDTELKTVKSYQWNTTVSEPKLGWLKQMKITKDSEVALFFGRDFATNGSTSTKLKAEITGVYSKQGGWQKPKNKEEVQIKKALFPTTSEGRWTETTITQQ